MQGLYRIALRGRRAADPVAQIDCSIAFPHETELSKFNDQQQ